MARCISPVRLSKPDGGFIDTPCGKCNYCLQNRRREWTFRLQKELREHESAHFLTLTYDDKNVPLMETADENGGLCYLPVLKKKHVQEFMKKLRWHQGDYGKMKYYAVGEYGTRTMRPHYHFILYGMNPELVPKLGEIWSYGFVDVGNVEDDSISYVTKYVVNKYELEGYVVPPFSAISNGIGLSHLSKNYKRYKDEQVVRDNRGVNQKMPRYYRDKLETNKYVSEISKARAAAAARKKEELERERLAKVHNDPDAYMEERQVHNHDKIARDAKKGNTL